MDASSHFRITSVALSYPCLTPAVAVPRLAEQRSHTYVPLSLHSGNPCLTRDSSRARSGVWDGGFRDGRRLRATRRSTVRSRRSGRPGTRASSQSSPAALAASAYVRDCSTGTMSSPLAVDEDRRHARRQPLHRIGVRVGRRRLAGVEPMSSTAASFPRWSTTASARHETPRERDRRRDELLRREPQRQVPACRVADRDQRSEPELAAPLGTPQPRPRASPGSRRRSRPAGTRRSTSSSRAHSDRPTSASSGRTRTSRARSRRGSEPRVGSAGAGQLAELVAVLAVAVRRRHAPAPRRAPRRGRTAAPRAPAAAAPPPSGSAGSPARAARRDRASRRAPPSTARPIAAERANGARRHSTAAATSAASSISAFACSSRRRRKRFDDEPPFLCRFLTKREPTFDVTSRSPSKTPTA